MSKTLSLRFQKMDKYDNPVFCASDKNPDEKKTFDTLSSYHASLQSKDLGTFLPIYSSCDFASIRFKKNQKHNNFHERNVYEIVFTIRSVTRDSKTYINCFIDSAKLTKRAIPLDLGTVLDL